MSGMWKNNISGTDGLATYRFLGKKSYSQRVHDHLYHLYHLFHLF